MKLFIHVNTLVGVIFFAKIMFIAFCETNGETNQLHNTKLLTINFQILVLVDIHGCHTHVIMEFSFDLTADRQHVHDAVKGESFETCTEIFI